MTADPAAARVNVLLDPDDDAAVTAGLLARHDPAGGRVVVHPTPGTRGRLSLAHDLLHALGRPVGLLRADHIGGVHHAWLAATAWIIADRVEHLVVLRAHRLDADGWTLLVDLARAARVALLLVCHTRTVAAHHRVSLHDVAHQVFTDLPGALHELGLARPRPVRDLPPRRQYAKLPGRLPTGQVLHYRADVYRQHARETFTRVDDLYGHGLDEACRWLRHAQGPPARQTNPSDARLQQFLTELVHDSPTPQHTLAQLRGVQAGFLLHGHWLAIPALGPLGGPGLTSTAVTFDIAERIRAGVAHPVLAAGVALALFTGINLLSLRSLRLDDLLPPTQVVTMPFRIDKVPRLSNGKLRSGAPHVGTAVFHVPLAARPLLRAARAFLRARSPDLHQRVFAKFSPMHLRIEEAAARCGLTLPGAPAELIGAWQMRVRWTGLDDPAHTDRAEPGPPPGAGRSCLTARAPATDPAGAAPLYRDPRDELGKRWSPLNAPAFVPGLLRAYLDGTEPTMRGYRDHEMAYMPAWERDRIRRRDLVAQHLAVRVPPAGPDDDRITVHPDLPFAMRLTDRPAPVEDHRPPGEAAESTGVASRDGTRGPSGVALETAEGA